MAVVNVTLITNAGRKVDQVSDSMTIRQIYDKYNVNYSSCTNTVDSVPLQIGDLDKSLRDLGCGARVRMSSIVKADNAAKVIIAGTAAVVKSTYKLDQWEKALKYDPDLGLYDENEEPFFKAFVEAGPGSLNDNGVVFSEIPDADGYAVATVLIDSSVEDKKQFVKDKLGLALVNLKMLEEGLEEVIQDAEKNDQELEKMVEAI